MKGSAFIIDQVASALENLGKLPTQCQISEIGPLKQACLFDDFPSGALIREDVYAGMDLDTDQAILKALIERTERLALAHAISTDPDIAACGSSDGTAAFPIGESGDTGRAEIQARTHALAEAIERFVWATWWDDASVEYELHPFASLGVQKDNRLIADAILQLSEPGQILRVQPRVRQRDDRFETVILYLVIPEQAVLSGGACGLRTHLDVTFRRALGELARHTAAFQALKSKRATAATFYERRLAFMASPDGYAKWAQRLAVNGQTPIEIPSLAIDRPLLNHPLAPLVQVHRCFLNGQPPFVGGSLERLCL
jgi:hypothetical protein